MNRTQLAHVLRSASRIAGDVDVLVGGSQAISGSRAEDDLPAEAGKAAEDAFWWAFRTHKAPAGSDGPLSRARQIIPRTAARSEG